ncbi:MAG: hypothetical protein P4L99_04915 [Chthoniobacter sp.]|nr:hypothetical protein [Chthoniobacter sp.]
MKKSNRIERKGAIRARQAQAKRPVKTPARKSRPHSIATPWNFPYHKLAPRSPVELRELRAFTANLGEYLGSCVFASGDADHLFRRCGQFYLVGEWLRALQPSTKRHTVHNALAGAGLTLEEYLECLPKTRFERRFGFEPLGNDEVNRWAEKTGVAERLPMEIKRAIWAIDEVDGKTKGRLILCSVNSETGRDRRRIYDRCGSFVEEIEESGETKPIRREDVVERLRDAIIRPALNKLPREFEGDLHVAFRDYGARPAEPVNTLRG